MSLDDVLAERERIEKMIQEIVEKNAAAWGLEITGIRLLDIELPEELKKMISRQAAAEREKRATITKAEGDKLAADNLAAAANHGRKPRRDATANFADDRRTRTDGLQHRRAGNSHRGHGTGPKALGRLKRRP